MPFYAQFSTQNASGHKIDSINRYHLLREMISYILIQCKKAPADIGDIMSSMWEISTEKKNEIKQLSKPHS